MSSRHRSSRRRQYGRRQHELRERRSRSAEWQLDPVEFARTEADERPELSLHDTWSGRLSWALER
jgi:hypothetical protein